MNINYEMVDLGLPSGTLWAKCNLGAMTETENGLWFQWGDIKEHSFVCGHSVHKRFDRNQSPFIEYVLDKHKNAMIYMYGKYSKEDGKVRLDRNDDVISKHMGLSYRMPTKEDFDELIINTDHYWLKNYEGSGVSGLVFESKVNDNKIFIPSNGYVASDCIIGCNDRLLHNCTLWSSSLINTNNLSYYAYSFSASSSKIVGMHANQRHIGFGVRGVRDK